MTQERKQKQTTSTAEVEETAPTDVRNEELAQATDETLDNIDDVLGDQDDDELLADMDDVLEENAQEFVANYVQQGGQ